MGSKKGGKKATMQATAILNPQTGKLSGSKEETIQATLTYCKETLRNNEPGKDFKEEIDRRKRKKLLGFFKKKNGDFKATKETFEQIKWATKCCKYVQKALYANKFVK